MAYKLFEEIVLTKDIPGKRLKKGDVATIVDHHPVSNGEWLFIRSIRCARKHNSRHNST